MTATDLQTGWTLECLELLEFFRVPLDLALLQGARPAPEHDDDMLAPHVGVPIIELDGKRRGHEVVSYGSVIYPDVGGCFTAAPHVYERAGLSVDLMAHMRLDEVLKIDGQQWHEVEHMLEVLAMLSIGRRAFVQYPAPVAYL